MTCSAAMRRTGPFKAGVNPIFFDISECSRSAVRVTEIALQMNDALPARIIRLLEEGSHVKTSGVIASLYRARTYFRASIVSFELIATLPASSCSAPPNDQRTARRAMLESI